MSELPTSASNYLDSKWVHTVEMFVIPLDELSRADATTINSMLLVPGNAILILSTLSYPGCVIYVESPYDKPMRTLEDLEPCWKVFSKSFCRVILHCQQHNYAWLRLCP